MAQIMENMLFGSDGIKKTSFVRRLVVFAFCVFAWVFFVAHSLRDACYVVTNFLDGVSSPIKYMLNGFSDIGMGSEVFAVIVFCVMIMFFYDYISLKIDFSEWLMQKRCKSLWVWFYGFVALMIVFLSNKGVAAEFIYFQF